ncbi:Phosphoglycolate phosphatase [uncultured archaeon]|nr:Phosphoglycolate phosphatase [uncultured archaeon]
MKLLSKRQCSLNFEVASSDGATTKFDAKFRVGFFGKAHLLAEKHLPEQLSDKYKDTALGALLSKSDYSIVETLLGWRLMDKEGRIYQYEFTIEFADGTMGIPFKKGAFGSLLRFLDLRNMGLSKKLDGATIRIKVNDVVLDLKNSSFREIKQVYKSVNVYNLDGTMSCAYVGESVPLPQYGARQNESDFLRFQQFSVQDAELSGEQSVFQVMLRMRSLAGFRRYPAKQHAFQMEDGINYSHWGADGKKVQQEMIIPQPPLLQQAGFPSGILGEELQISTNAVSGSHEANASQNAKEGQTGGLRVDSAKKSGSIGASAAFSKQESPGSHALRHTFGKGRPIPFSQLSSFKAVIFDFDGVVGDTMELHRKSFNDLLAQFGIHIGKKEFRNYGGRRAETIIQGLFDRHGIKESAAEWDRKRTALYGQYLQKHGAKPIPGFIAFLHMLKRNGIKTAVASSGEAPHVRNALKHMNVSLPSVTVKHVRHAKPAPDLFLLAAKKLSVEPKSCIVIEDALSGIEAARRAEMPCIALSTTLPASELKSRATLVAKDFNSPVLAKLIPKLLMKNRAANGKDSTVKANRISGGRKKKANEMRALLARKRKSRKKSALPYGKNSAKRTSKKRKARRLLLLRRR